MCPPSCRTLLLLATLLLLGWPSLALAQLRGVVKDARSGEALSKARLTAGENVTLSDSQGRFEIPRAAELRVSLVGYRTLTIAIKPAQAEAAPELELLLTPDGLSQRDSIEVKEGPFTPQSNASPSERSLNSAELRNLAGVIANDPLRAVQSLPGVASNNDFTASFSARGADFRRAGIYLDGVLMNNPLHSTQGQQASGSLSMWNTDVIEAVTLHPSAAPVGYMDRSGPVLEMLVREGSEKGLAWRLNTGVAATSLVAEGPWAGKKGTWLASVRKSYLQYLLQKARAIDTLAFGFFDVQTKLGYNLTRKQHLSLGYFDGVSDLDRSSALSTLGVNAILNGSYHLSNVQLGHRWALSPSLMLSNKLAWLRERGSNQNVLNLPLSSAGYGEWVANSAVEWKSLRAGTSFRQIRDDGFEARYIFNPLSVRRRDPWGGRALRAGGYVEQGFARGILSGTLGSRWDASSTGQPASMSPTPVPGFAWGRPPSSLRPGAMRCSMSRSAC